jgi:hypothetical protein
MGFLSSIVMGSSAFILGMVFVCQVVSQAYGERLERKMVVGANSQVDIPLLYMPVTDAALENAYTFYTIWFESPGAVKVGACGSMNTSE